MVVLAAVVAQQLAARRRQRMAHLPDAARSTSDIKDALAWQLRKRLARLRDIAALFQQL